MVISNDLLSIAKGVFNEEISQLTKIKERLDSNFLNAINLILNASGKVIVTGVGKSGIIGHKISASLASTGTHSVFMNSAEGLHGDLGIINENDIVIAISNSGSSSEVMSLIPSIHRIGAKVIAMTGNLSSPLANAADTTLDIGVEREADNLNIAPTSSTTATLVMGDALTVALIKEKKFDVEKFAVYHPGGALGRRLLTKVRDVMQTSEKVATANQNANLTEIVEKLTLKNLGVVCIMDTKERVIGIITDGDIRRALKNKQENFFNEVAYSIMTEDFKYISPDVKAVEALKVMEIKEKRISSLPVLTEEKQLMGLIRLHDLYDINLNG